ncbi:MAG: DUF4230 domain-containing protein [Paludibacteraceae bacterium]|nr:DUF4230 domain-containing protein [Paludibacteraceae bacterium]
MKKTKIILVILVIIAILASAAYIAIEKGLLDFKSDNLKIDETANVVKEIKNISEFTSACFYEEIILQEKKTSNVVDNSIVNEIAGFFGKKEGLITDEIVIIAKGKVRAGFNLKKMSEDDIHINGDTLTINLPEAEIFDVIVNPSDFDIYIENGIWDEQKVAALKNKAVTKIQEDALSDGILVKASQSGVKRLSEMFKAFGFSVVKIIVKISF